MKTLQIALVLVLAISINSCKTLHSTTVKETDVSGPTVIQKPVIADLDVKEVKVSGTFSGSSNLSIPYAKEMAVSNALKAANADVLVEPRYEVTKSFRKIDVSVTGYPATYKNFRPMEVQDTIFLNTAAPSTGINLFEKKTGKLNNGRILLVSAGVAIVGAITFLALY